MVIDEEKRRESTSTSIYTLIGNESRRHREKEKKGQFGGRVIKNVTNDYIVEELGTN